MSYYDVFVESFCVTLTLLCHVNENIVFRCWIYIPRLCREKRLQCDRRFENDNSFHFDIFVRSEFTFQFISFASENLLARTIKCVHQKEHN